MRRFSLATLVATLVATVLVMVGTISVAQNKFSDADCSPDLFSEEAAIESACAQPEITQPIIALRETARPDKIRADKTQPAKARIIYEIVGDLHSQTIIATVDGVRYRAFTPEMGASDIIAQLDTNNDGYVDLVHSWSGGGNCCAPSYAVLLYQGAGVFKNLTHDDFWAWSNPTITTEAGQVRMQVDSVVSGVGHTDSSETINIFEVVNGALQIVKTTILDQMLPALAEIKDSDYETYGIAKTQRVQIGFDVNDDGRQDILSCGWWDRWGALLCQVELAGGGVIEITTGCTRIGILASRQDGLRDIVCGREQIGRFQRAVGTYVFD